VRLRLSRSSGSPVISTLAAAPAVVALPAAAASAAIATPAPAATAPEPENLVYVKSPIVGTFYKAPTPTSDPFVSVGDHVEKGAVLCIIEAMKLFNEIESEVKGTIVKVMIEDSAPVEYDQVLFLIEP